MNFAALAPTLSAEADSMPLRLRSREGVTRAPRPNQPAA